MATSNPNAPPSVDPANEGSLEGVIETIKKKFLQGIDDMLPARVMSYDRTSNRATIQPVVAMVSTAGAQVQRAQIASVPVLLLGGGGHMLSFNLKAGDFGWLKANDRDTSLFLQSFGDGGPNTHRMHSFEDAMFIPDAMRNFVIDPEDEENAVFQTLDGSTRIALWADKIKLTSGDTTFEMGAAGVTFNGPSFKLNGKELINHVHSNVTNGPSNTGPNV